MKSDSHQSSSLMKEDETVSDAENFVVDVETKIQKRLSKARQNKQNVEESDTSKENYSWSPPVIGAEYIEPRYSNDIVRLKLSSDLPNGNNTLNITVPSQENIEDESTELNRLLSYYNIELDEISDLIGERIPIRKKGNTIKVDYPPISTIPNNIKYKSRRLCEKYGLLRWGHTPKIQNDTYYYSRNKSYNYIDKRTAPSISSIVFEHTIRFQEENVATTVLTVKGATSLFVSIFMILNVMLLSVYVLTSSIGLWISTCILFAFLQFFNLLLNVRIIKEGFKKLKTWMFPK